MKAINLEFVGGLWDGQTLHGDSLNQEESRLADEKMEAEIAKLESDPNVQTLKDMFGATLKADTVQIIDAPGNE